MNEESLREEVEIKLLWITHTMSDSEKRMLEDCVIDLLLRSESADGERRVAFNRGMVWATEYLTRQRLRIKNGKD